MMTCKGSPLLRKAILICGLMLARGIPAQTFTTLHSFTVGSGSSSPYGGLVLHGSTLYGTTYFDPISATYSVVHGAVFAIGGDGMAFTNLHSFPPFDEVNPINTEGNGPMAGLTLSGSSLYGTTVLGGNFGYGTVFVINTDGTGFAALHDFNRSSDGYDLHGRLLLSGDTLYGTAAHGGSDDNGTVFALSTNGTGFKVLHTFTAGNDGGLSPYGALVLSGNTLYGTAAFGVAPAGGTIFGLNVDGTGFTVLHTFTASSVTNSDGSEPLAGLILSGSTLYGVAAHGGSGGNGTVFAMNTDGTGFTILHNFTATPPQSPARGSLPATNADGALPQGELILSNNTLYGAAAAGGSWSQGTVFAINTDATGFTVLHTFDGTDASGPNGGLILSGNTLYGTAATGGNSFNGTVFSISFSPQPKITPSGSAVILSWPTNYAGFDYRGYRLQSTTNLNSPAWTAVDAVPLVVNGQATATNPISAAQEFFRLSY